MTPSSFSRCRLLKWLLQSRAESWGAPLSAPHGHDGCSVGVLLGCFGGTTHPPCADTKTGGAEPQGFYSLGGGRVVRKQPGAVRKRDKTQSLLSKPTRVGAPCVPAELPRSRIRPSRIPQAAAPSRPSGDRSCRAGCPPCPRSALAAGCRALAAPPLAGQRGPRGRGRRDDDGGHVEVLLSRGRRQGPVAAVPAAHTRLQAWGSLGRG